MSSRQTSVRVLTGKLPAGMQAGREERGMPCMHSVLSTLVIEMRRTETCLLQRYARGECVRC